MKIKSILIAGSFFLLACSSKPEKLTNLTVVPAQVVLKYGDGSNPESQQAYATYLPKDLKDVKITWSSANESVASVTQTGLITATGVGSTIVTVVANNLSEIIWVSSLSVNPVVVVYGGSNFTGFASELATGEYTGWEYDIASIAITEGIRVKLHRNEKSGGGFLSL